ncbi:hypothetical protein SRHO_G00001400 [Serrasalmus rhombeus]
MSSRRFTAEEVLSQLINWDSDVEEEISEMEDSSEPEDNDIDDPDCQFSHDDEDSEDESTSVPSTDENQETQQSSSTEWIWTSKDGTLNRPFQALYHHKLFKSGGVSLSLHLNRDALQGSGRNPALSSFTHCPSSVRAC